MASKISDPGDRGEIFRQQGFRVLVALAHASLYPPASKRKFGGRIFAPIPAGLAKIGSIVPKGPSSGHSFVVHPIPLFNASAMGPLHHFADGFAVRVPLGVAAGPARLSLTLKTLNVGPWRFASANLFHKFGRGKSYIPFSLCPP